MTLPPSAATPKVTTLERPGTFGVPRPIPTAPPSKPAGNVAYPGPTVARPDRSTARANSTGPGTVEKVASQIAGAERRLDHVLALARSGRTFTPSELLALQAQVYSASELIDLSSKVVEKAVGGLKQIIQTQI